MYISMSRWERQNSSAKELHKKSKQITFQNIQLRGNINQLRGSTNITYFPLDWANMEGRKF